MSSNLTKIDKKQLLQILKKHELWLNNDENGEEADFGNIDVDESSIGEMYGKCFKSFGCKSCSE
jgi:hypothetical protein